MARALARPRGWSDPRQRGRRELGCGETRTEVAERLTEREMCVETDCVLCRAGRLILFTVTYCTVRNNRAKSEKMARKKTHVCERAIDCTTQHRRLRINNAK